jgi:hypothetical protein
MPKRQANDVMIPEIDSEDRALVSEHPGLVEEVARLEGEIARAVTAAVRENVRGASGVAVEGVERWRELAPAVAHATEETAAATVRAVFCPVRDLTAGSADLVREAADSWAHAFKLSVERMDEAAASLGAALRNVVSRSVDDGSALGEEISRFARSNALQAVRVVRDVTLAAIESTRDVVTAVLRRGTRATFPEEASSDSSRTAAATS